MKIINAGYEFINEPSITKKIERIARICYKSEDKIGEGTDAKMIKDLLKRQHTAMLEHGSIAVQVDGDMFTIFKEVVSNITTIIMKEDKKDLERNYLRYTAFLEINEQQDDYTPIRYIVSGNIRAWIQAMDLLENRINFAFPESMKHVLTEISPEIFGGYNYTDEKYHQFDLITDYSQLLPEERMVHEDITVKFTVDRGITHELVRHRDCSFAQESTRYCNYNLGKYGNEITVIKPCFWEEDSEAYKSWKRGCSLAENEYIFMTRDLKVTAQQARDILPTSVKAEIVMTANLREWKHIFNLRACNSTGPAHPQMLEVMIPCLKELRPKYEFAFGDLVAADEVHN